MMVRLLRSQIDDITEHSREIYPVESCGVLAGKDDHVCKVYRGTNRVGSSTLYTLEPEELYSILTEIEAGDMDVIGIYHSHPYGRAYPSETDVELAFFPESSWALFPGTAYIIISLLDLENPVIKAFGYEDREVFEIEIEVLDDISI